MWPSQLNTMDKRLGSSRFKSLECRSRLAVVGCRTLIYPTPRGGMTIPEPQGGKGTWERWHDPQTTCTGWRNGNLSKGERISRKILVDPWQPRSGASENDRRKGVASKPKLLSPHREPPLLSLSNRKGPLQMKNSWKCCATRSKPPSSQLKISALCSWRPFSAAGQWQ